MNVRLVGEANDYVGKVKGLPPHDKDFQLFRSLYSLVQVAGFLLSSAILFRHASYMFLLVSKPKI